MLTVRELIEMLAESAAGLADGLDTAIELGICDGENLQILDQIDVDYWAFVPEAGTGGTQFVLIRGHHHPGEGAPGRVLRGAASDADEELRRLTDESDE